ncbi:MAG TPA: glutamate 5-kinase [Oribacterium sp.]|jgi:glutamate 5-kinase|nr:glutamate 5-kinase [Oribacterium sp.]
MDSQQKRALLKEKKRIVIKVGSASITHPETGDLNLSKIEKLVRVITDLKGEGREVILVSSGAIASGRQTLGIRRRPKSMAEKQAFAAVGQAKLMMTYQKLFFEYSEVAAQLLLTKNIMINPVSRENAANTFIELLNLGAIPVVNENDTISTSEIAQVESFGDNDQLAAIVAAITGADLVILLSDIDGVFTDDPKQNPEAEFISYVPVIDEHILKMGKSTSGSNVGTGGMSAKLAAARIATDSGADMVIARFSSAEVIQEVISGKEVGTLFAAHKNQSFDILEYIQACEK